MSGFVKKDFVSSSEVKWCPGCGDYAILAAMQKFLPQTGLAPEQLVFVSGIGCAGRFPYYLNTFGFHTIHGRAPAVATGIKMMRPELSVWLVTGDGDGLSIGAGQLLHCLRRDLDINILMLNNQIYGLTKGQVSPTSPLGQISKTSPKGSCHQPLNPLQLALSAGATFVARGLDKEPNHLVSLFDAAYSHSGSAFIEIYQNCPIFNDGAYADYDHKTTRAERALYLKEGELMAFGAEDNRQFVTGDNQLSVTNRQDVACVHDQTNKQRAYQLANWPIEGMPLPLGIYYQESSPLPERAAPKITAGFEQLSALL